MRYVYLRLFLTEVQIPPLLVEMEGESTFTRRDFLKRIFNERREFNHRGTDFIFQPIETESESGRTYCFGRIGKKVTDTINEGPDKLFETTSRESWRAANVILDVESDPLGQRLAFQDRGDVGKPLAIMNSFAISINENSETNGWFLEVNAMTEKQSFWEAVSKHKGDITRAEFNYVTPNVLGIKDKLNERLKEYKERENATEVSVILQNPKGDLQLETEEVHDAMNVISEGGGSAKLKSGREILFDSEDTEKAKDVITDDVIQLEQADSRRALVERFFR